MRFVILRLGLSVDLTLLLVLLQLAREVLQRLLQQVLCLGKLALTAVVAKPIEVFDSRCHHVRLLRTNVLKI